MNSVIDLQNPKDIYESLKNKISNLIDTIVKNEDILDENLVGEKFNESKHVLNFQKKEIERKMDELQRNAEWNYFTIAFFGETNAGKSTLIEALRLLFKEKTKIEIQAKFNALKKEFSLDENEYEQLKSSENEINEKNLINNQKLKELEQFYTQKLEDQQITLNNLRLENEEKIIVQSFENESKLTVIHDQLVSLKEIIEYKKQNMTWWLKIIYIFKRLDEEKQNGLLKSDYIHLKSQLNEKENLLKQQLEKDYTSKKSNLMEIQSEYDSKRVFHNSINLELEKEKQDVEAQLQQFEKMLEKLREYEDGQIMGDGRSDYTRLSKEFLFDINGTQVKLIDVPGIEGNENLVENEISNAVKKAHAVFYVTSKDAAPNEGTLAKIKTHLADQTEVWTIYNKPVTSPRSLKKGLISNEDERDALNDLNKLMIKVLDKNYRDYTVVAGLAGFYAVADCLVPFGEKYRNQLKFLNDSSCDELKEKSGLQSFQNHLAHQIIGDVPFKIKSSNFNKANYIILKTVEKLNKIHDEFSELKLNIDKQLAVTKQEIESDYLDLTQSLKTMIKKNINRFEHETREEVYRNIDKDISNDDFKKILKQEITINLETVSDELTDKFKEQTNLFDKNIKQKLKKLSTRLTSIQNNFISDNISGLNGSISLKLDINSGINKMGLVGVGIGIATMWWNPAGWVVMTLTAVGLLFSFAKAIWSFFDSDFKKSEQKKSADKNLSNIVKELRKVSGENLSRVEDKIDPSILELKKKLNEPSDQINTLVQDINQSIKMFNALSINISRTYGVK